MGQYYRPMVLTKNERNQDRPAQWINSHDVKTKYKRNDGKTMLLGQGLKLMEHSWMNNPLCQLVEYLLLPGNAWHKQPIVWAGDYADGEYHNTYNWMDINGVIHTHEENLYNFCKIENKYKVGKKPKLLKKFKYILNHTTKQFVDKTKVPKDKDGWQIHPLPLLTCEGNNRGGGDYRGDNNIIGSWARHIISVDAEIPEDYTELIFDITE